MSRRKQSITKDQDHLLHILLIASFFIAMMLTQTQNIVDKPLLVFSVAILYVIANSYIDAKANVFSLDQSLLYATIATFASLIVLSL